MPEEQQTAAGQPPKEPTGFKSFFAKKMDFDKTEETTPVAASAPAAKPAEKQLQPAKPTLPTIGASKAPAEKAPDKPAEAAPEHEDLTDEPPANLSPKASESWKQFRQKANDKIRAAAEYRAKYETTQKELDLLKKVVPQKGELPPEFDAIKKERDELSGELKRTNLARHPEFKKHFDGRFNSALELAKEAVGKDLAEAVAKAIKNGDTDKLEDLSGELSPLKAGQLANANAAYRAADQERESLLARAESELQAAESNTQQGQAKSQEQFHKRVQEVTVAALEYAASLESFSPKEGDAEHNANVHKNQQFVKDFYAGKVDDELVKWTPALAAEALHLKAVKIPALESEIKKRDDIIASYTKGTPKLDGGAGGGGGGAGKPAGFLQVYNANAPKS